MSNRPSSSGRRRSLPPLPRGHVAQRASPLAPSPTAAVTRTIAGEGASLKRRRLDSARTSSLTPASTPDLSSPALIDEANGHSGLPSVPDATSAALFAEIRALRDESCARMEAIEKRLTVVEALAKELQHNNVGVSQRDAADVIRARLVELRHLAQKRPKIALEALLKDKQVAGTRQAMVEASVLLRSGAGVRFDKAERFEKDFGKAWELLDRVEDMGGGGGDEEENALVEALVAKGHILASGLGRAADVSTAEEYFRAAVDFALKAERPGDRWIVAGKTRAKGNPRLGAALYQLGKHLYRVANDACKGTADSAEGLMTEAKQTLEDSLGRGEGRAGVILGHAFLNRNKTKAARDVFGVGKTENWCEREALRIYRLAADLGSAEAMNNIGELHHMGRAGLTKSMRVGMSWFTRASEAGLSRAFANVGRGYESLAARALRNGSVEESNGHVDSAQRWYRVGVTKGDAFSAAVLAALICGKARGGTDAERAEEMLRHALVLAQEGERPDRQSFSFAGKRLAALFWTQSLLDSHGHERWEQKCASLLGPSEARRARAEFMAIVLTISAAEVIGEDALLETGLTCSEAVEELQISLGEVGAILFMDSIFESLKFLDASVLSGQHCDERVTDLERWFEPVYFTVLKRVREEAMSRRRHSDPAGKACVNAPWKGVCDVRGASEACPPGDAVEAQRREAADGRELVNRQSISPVDGPAPASRLSRERNPSGDVFRRPGSASMTRLCGNRCSEGAVGFGDSAEDALARASSSRPPLQPKHILARKGRKPRLRRVPGPGNRVTGSDDLLEL